MKNKEKRYTTVRVSRDTLSLINDVNLWCRHKDGRKHNVDESLGIFITNYMNEFRDEIIKTKINERRSICNNINPVEMAELSK